MEEDASIYRLYISDALKTIGSLNIRYADLLDKSMPTESAEEIKERIKNHLKSLSGK